MKHFLANAQIISFLEVCYITNWLTNSMELILPLGNNSPSSQEIPCILCRLKPYYCAHKNPSLVRSQSQNNPFQT
jgi:hypothetical protein